MKLTRESAVWWFGVVSAILCGLATLDADTAAKVAIPLAALPYLRLYSLVVGLGSAWAKTSPFPSKHDAPSAGSVDLAKIAPLALLVLALGAASFSVTGCAAKSQPTVTPQVQQLQQAKKVLDAVKRVGLVVEQVQLSEEQLFLAGQVPTQTHVDIQKAFKKAADAVLVASDTLTNATTATDPAATVKALADGLKQISLSLAHLSPKQGAQLAGWIDTASALIEVALL